METIQNLAKDYLAICRYRKRLDQKTLKAYTIDLRQFCDYLESNQFDISRKTLSTYLMDINQRYKPSSVKRKIATLKAFFNYLEMEEIFCNNPFHRLSIGMREPIHLPRTVPLRIIESMLHTVYLQIDLGTPSQRAVAIRDAAIMEMLFATGVRVSELCHLDVCDVDLLEGNIRIDGKGAKERLIQIGNPSVLAILRRYSECSFQTQGSAAFFKNRLGRRISEQSVRLILRRYETGVHVTPHMIRHSFATFLLEESVDIRYIQRMLGHSSIATTQIYTHVTAQKQKEILTTKHPRNKILP